MRYLFISYKPDKSLKENQWYDNLDQIKEERGITSNEVLPMPEIPRSNYSPIPCYWDFSSDGSGCFLLDFIDGEINIIDFENYAYSDILLGLMKQMRRDEKLNELGI